MRPGDLKVGNPIVFPLSALEAIQSRKGANQGQPAGPPGFGAPPVGVHEPGGDIVRRMVHPTAFTIFEQLYRTLPEGGWYSPAVSPSSPVQFEMGVFIVPPGQNLWLFDYQFTVFRQSGIDPGDMIPAEEGRFGGVMGFDINFSGRRMSNLLYQLDPVNVQLQRPTFQRPPSADARASPSQFNVAAANSFASSANPGTSLLPVRSNVQGARHSPFVLVAQEGDRVSLNTVIFRPVPSPLASIQGRSAGYLLHTQASSSLIDRLRPR